MYNYRKRRSTESLEIDRKKFMYEYDCTSYIKRENYRDSAGNNLRSKYRSNPYDFSTVDEQHVSEQRTPRYYNFHYDKPYKYIHMRKSASPHSADAIFIPEDYDNRRQLNFTPETYVKTLQFLDSRHVNLNDLNMYLINIDIRSGKNSNFSTAFDLAEELEQSLKFFIDTKNEIIFLRKLYRQHYIPFSYNEINIANNAGLSNRIKFLENESAYRSNRMNQLFQTLQSIVIPSVMDDIRHVHTISYEKSWTNRARYWFIQFKRIRWHKVVLASHSSNYRDKKYKRLDSRYRGEKVNRIKDEKIDYRDVNIKSEVAKSRVSPQECSPKIDKVPIKEAQVISAHHINQILNKVQIDKSIQTVSTAVNESVTIDCNSILPLANTTAEQQNVRTVEDTNDVTNADENSMNVQGYEKKEHEDKDAEKSVIIIDPNISVITVTDEIDPNSSNIADFPKEDDS